MDNKVVNLPGCLFLVSVFSYISFYLGKSDAEINTSICYNILLIEMSADPKLTKKSQDFLVNMRNADLDASCDKVSDIYKNSFPK